MNASRIGLRRRDFRDRDLDLEWRDEEGEAFEVKDDDVGGVYSKGEPSVVVTLGEMEAGVARGKLNVGT